MSDTRSSMLAFRALVAVGSAALWTSFAFASAKGVDVRISGMHCASCAKSVKAALSAVPDLEPGSIVVDLKENKATVQVKEGKAVPKGEIEAAIKRVGYDVTMVQESSAAPASKP